MSLKQQLHEAIEMLSEPMTLEDAVERLYHALHLQRGDRRVIRLEGALRCEVPVAGDPTGDALAPRAMAGSSPSRDGMAGRTQNPAGKN